MWVKLTKMSDKPIFLNLNAYRELHPAGSLDFNDRAAGPNRNEYTALVPSCESGDDVLVLVKESPEQIFQLAGETWNARIRT